MPDQTCTHIDAISTAKQPKRRECQECVKIGGTWVHLMYFAFSLSAQCATEAS